MQYNKPKIISDYSISNYSKNDDKSKISTLEEKIKKYEEIIKRENHYRKLLNKYLKSSSVSIVDFDDLYCDFCQLKEWFLELNKIIISIKMNHSHFISDEWTKIVV